ncbi:phosphoribosyl-AMP cyclohydrolase [Rathayibacter sp. CAU 1779]
MSATENGTSGSADANATVGTSADVSVADSRQEASRILDRVRFDDKGLLTAVIQQWDSKEVLMVGWMDREAFLRTMTEGRVTFWSRSRQEYWRKGDTSGHAQYVRGAALDCDGDTLLVRVEQIGAACHTGTRTCFDADQLDPVEIDVPSIVTSPVSPSEGDA